MNQYLSETLDHILVKVLTKLKNISCQSEMCFAPASDVVFTAQTADNEHVGQLTQNVISIHFMVGLPAEWKSRILPPDNCGETHETFLLPSSSS